VLVNLTPRTRPFRRIMQTGAVNVFMTLVTVYLMDRLGRRSLLLTGLVGMAISYGVVTGAPLSSGQ